MGTQGLREAGQRSAMLRANFLRSRPQRFGLVPRCGPADPSLRRRSLHATHPAASRKPVFRTVRHMNDGLPAIPSPCDLVAIPCKRGASNTNAIHALRRRA
jgi:hypothetical protein